MSKAKASLCIGITSFIGMVVGAFLGVISLPTPGSTNMGRFGIILLGVSVVIFVLSMGTTPTEPTVLDVTKEE